MDPIKKVVVIGAGGNLGHEMVKGLVAQDFQVSLLARPTSQLVNHYNLTILRSDFSPASLIEALTGQDAIVSTLGFTGLAEQVKIVDAAEKAGVRRFIPSEFGSDTMKPSLPEFEAMMDVKLSLLKHLEERAAANPAFTWTGIANGPFFDWGLKTAGALGFNLATKSAVIYDSGNEPVSATNIGAVAAATGRALHLASKTANKYICISSITTTQNEILVALEEATGAEWSITRASTQDLVEQGREKLAKGDYSCFLEFLPVHLFQDGGKRIVVSPSESSRNELLGVPALDLNTVVRDVLRQ